tara:strand:- start:417 stop:1187 length:771 start_codon:yes stop_codon:yes gene_type:complete
VASAYDRMEFMKDQMNELNIGFERLNAVAIKDLIYNNNEAYWKTWERPIKPSEQACFLSHIKAWEAVINENIPILILEDDAILVKDLNEVLNLVSNLKDIDYISLEIRNRKKLLSTVQNKLNSKYKISRLYQDRSGAAAYVLWPSGAKKLIKRTKKHAALTDAMICMSYELLGYQIEPACAVQLDSAENYGLSIPISSNSTIHTGSNEGRVDLLQFNGIKYKIRRILSQLKMGIRFLSKLFSAKKRFVEFNINNFL